MDDVILFCSMEYDRITGLIEEALAKRDYMQAALLKAEQGAYTIVLELLIKRIQENE